jgi:hypothetical protein
MCLRQALVDLKRCRGYFQCALLAHAAIESSGDQVLHYDPVHLPRSIRVGQAAILRSCRQTFRLLEHCSSCGRGVGGRCRFTEQEREASTVSASCRKP